MMEESTESTESGWCMMDDGRKYRKYEEYTLLDDGWKYIKYRMRNFDETFWKDNFLRHFYETFWQDILTRHFDKTYWWPLKNFDDLYLPLIWLQLCH